jgi:hypothetical protein
MKIDEIRLLRKDVLITSIDKNEVVKSVIHVIEHDEQQQALNYFKVLRVSDKVTEVVPGDIIILGMGNHTVPVMVENMLVAVTSEDDIEAVVEE